MSENKKNSNHRPYYRHSNQNNSEKKQVKGEPHPLFDTCIKLEKAIEAKTTEENLIQAVGISWNKYAWFEEHEAELDPSSKEYSDMCEKTDQWCEEYHKMVEKLKSFLGLNNDATFALPELTAVMNRNGYCDENGLWKRK